MNRWSSRLLFSSIILIGLLGASQVFGQDIVGGLIEGASWMLLTVAQICIGLTVFFLRFFITLASYNNYIDVSIVRLGWAMVRDVANMFFVIALLVIAFTTILGLEQYEWKKGLAKLIIMAIFINFSNLIAQVIIDAAHVFTITFLNAISATAGGNLISMFKLDKIISMVADPNLGVSPDGVHTAIFGASVVAVLFAIFSAVALGSYMIVMAIRVVILWALIILSPLAYLLYALPKGEKYAQEWWSEFMKHVVVAPIMVFFLWLAFATLGSGNILDEIQADQSVIPLEQGETSLAVSISSVSSWEEMANYLIALIFLMIGLKKTQESGVQGAEVVGSAKNLGKKVAGYATGLSAAKWTAGTAWKGTKLAAWKMPGVGGETWTERAKTLGTDLKGYYYSKTAGISKESLKKDQELAKASKGLTESEDRGKLIQADIAKLQAERGKAVESEDTEKIKEIDTKITQKEETLAKEGATQEEGKAIVAQKIEELKAIKPGAFGKFIGVMASSTVKRRKTMGKSEKNAELMENIAFARAPSQGDLIGSLTGGRIAMTIKDQDRLLEGKMAGEKGRKEAKTRRFTALGNYATTMMPRYKDGKWQETRQADGTMKSETITEETERHKVEADITESHLKTGDLEARFSLIANEDPGGLGSLLAAAVAMATEAQESVTGREESFVSRKHIDSLNRSDDVIKKKTKDDEIIQRLDTADKAGTAAIHGLTEDLGTLEKTLGTLPASLERALDGKDYSEEERTALENILKDQTSVEKLEGLQENGEWTDASTDKLKKAIVNAMQNSKELENKYKTGELVEDQIPNEFNVASLGGEIEQRIIAGNSVKTVTLQRDEARKSQEKNREALTKRHTEIIDELDSENRIPAWRASREQASREHNALFYRGHRQEMVDNAAQKHIWDKHGITTPNNAHGEVIESLTTQFKAMNYEATVAAFAANEKVMSDKRESGEEITFEDRAVAMAIQNQMFTNAWVDDGIIPQKERQEARMAASKARARMLQTGKNKGKELTAKDIEKAEKHMASTSGSSQTEFGPRKKDDFAKLLTGVFGDKAKDYIDKMRGDRPKDNVMREIKVELTNRQQDVKRFAPKSLFDTTDIDEIMKKVMEKMRELDGETTKIEDMLRRL